MNFTKAEEIETACIAYIRALCVANNVAPDHGLEHAVFVGELAHIGLLDFTEITTSQALMVMLAALMHDLDDAKVFKTTGYANANAFLDTTPLSVDEKQFVVKMISLVSYSQNKNKIPDGIPKWAFIPRDADRIAGGGQEGIDRTLKYNARLPSDSMRPLITADDMRVFGNFPVDRRAVQGVFDRSSTRQKSLFEFYITNWHDRGICASDSKRLRAIFDQEYGVLLDFWVEQINMYHQANVDE